VPEQVDVGALLNPGRACQTRLMVGRRTAASRRLEGLACVAVAVVAAVLGCAAPRLQHVVYTPPDDAGTFGADFEAEHGADIAACLDAARAADPERIGRVVVNFAIPRDGTVGSAEIATNSTGDETLATCLLDVVTAARFESQATTRVISYPFFLQPSGGPRHPPLEVVIGPAQVNDASPPAEVAESEIARDVLDCLARLHTPAPWFSVPMLVRQQIQMNGQPVFAHVENPFPFWDHPMDACLLQELKNHEFPATGFVRDRSVPLTFLAAESTSSGLACGPPPGVPAPRESHCSWQDPMGEAEAVALCDSGCWDACSWLAAFYFEAARPWEAEEPACRACRGDPRECGPLGTVLLETGRIPEAEAALDAACGRVETYWDDIGPCIAYADLLAERGLFEKASAMFLDDEPETQDDTAAHCPIGAVCDDFAFPWDTRHNYAARYALMGGRPEEAEQLVRDCDFSRECRVMLAAALLAQGRTEEALATYREALDRHPELASAVDESLGLVASAYPELVATVEEVRQALGVQATSTEVDGDATPDAATLGDHGAPAGAEEAR
jgi:TonB family protein